MHRGALPAHYRDLRHGRTAGDRSRNGGNDCLLDVVTPPLYRGGTQPHAAAPSPHNAETSYIPPNG